MGSSTWFPGLWLRGPSVSGDAGAHSSDELPLYLDALYGHAPASAFVEMRYRAGSGMRQRFYRADEPAGLAAEITVLAASTDVYVGVLPRRRRAGGRRDVVARGSVLWADCDTGLSVSRAAAFRPAASMLVASGTGGHGHAYWLLREPVPTEQIVAMNRRLARALRADAASVDAARILRPPSLNHKRQPPTPVRLLRCDAGMRHRLDDFAREIVSALGEPATPRSVGRRTQSDPDDPLLGLPPELYVEALTGLTVPRDRKVRCPFHSDREPSLHVYEDPNRGWYCFGCQRGGSVYDFAALLWGVPTRGPAFRVLQTRLDDILSVIA